MQKKRTSRVEIYSNFKAYQWKILHVYETRSLWCIFKPPVFSCNVNLRDAWRILSWKYYNFYNTSSIIFTIVGWVLFIRRIDSASFQFPFKNLQYSHHYLFLLFAKRIFQITDILELIFSFLFTFCSVNIFSVIKLLGIMQVHF